MEDRISPRPYHVAPWIRDDFVGLTEAEKFKPKLKKKRLLKLDLLEHRKYDLEALTKESEEMK